MKIKRVSMLGFKSFVDKLEIGFPLGLSAIVGPNGCGKSNIVDAIRWAMGEQSARLLRGRQMEDVIFNGTADHKPFGMAEVSILFENGDGSFPLQYSHAAELAVTRRLFRSGESEYLINNVPCRLKDIQEIFMDTGLGNRAYSIIGQGQITTIIEQKPEETRAMIEEAAGITKYKKKADESLRKIEATQANLQRVEDILGEVEKQMRSLKRQSAKAKRYKAIGQEIQRLELILSAHAFQELKEESSERMKSAEALVREEIGRSTEYSRVQAKIESMNLELEEKDREVTSLREAHLKAKEKVSKKEAMVEAMAAEKRMQTELERRLEKDKEDLSRRLGELEKERGLLLERIQEVKEKAASIEEEISLVETRAKNRQELLKEIREVFEQARARVHSGMSKEASLTQESGFLARRIGEITDSRTRLEKEREEVRAKMETLLQAAGRKGELRKALVEKLNEIEKDVSGEEQRCHDLEQIRRHLESDLKDAQTALSVDESRLASLRSLLDNFEGYKVGVRTIMKAEDLEAKREGRIKGLVADVIQADPKYEQALEAVLGDKLQYILVESLRDGQQAVEYLKVRAKGKSSFVPVADLNGNGDNGSSSGFPLLRDLVKSPEAYKPVVDVLLGNAALAEDLNQALSAWEEYGKNQCLVTLEGDMIDRSGILTGGKQAQSFSGILARKREMKELVAAVVSHGKRLEEIKGRLEEAVQEKEERESILATLKEEKLDGQDKVNELDKANFQLSHELDQMDRLSQRISDELDQRDREQNKHKETLTRVESELLVCKEKRASEEAFFQQKEMELRESEEEFERFRNELARLRMNHSLSKEEQRGFTREVERIDDFVREAQETFRRIEGDVVAAQESQEDCVKKEEAIRDELKGLYAQLGQAEEAVNQADLERNQFKNLIREEEKKAEFVRGEVEALKEKIHTARMEQSEIGFKMDGLVEMTRGKYDLHLPDIYQEYLGGEMPEAEVRERLEHQKKLKGRLGEVNLTAIQEHEALKERYTFITTQRQDLLDSIASLQEAIRKINKTCLERFMETFHLVDEKLKTVFPILFNGGTANLKLVDEAKPLESGVLVEVQPPGKKLSHMALLSGGEKALVAMALIFAIYLIKPSPFLLLDEVDAPLDEANIDRFNELLKEIRKYSQIILVTHNRRSMEIVDRLYGVTMERQGVSKVVTVSLEGFQLH
jgi:chromosome segregation protein